MGAARLVARLLGRVRRGHIDMVTDGVAVIVVTDRHINVIADRVTMVGVVDRHVNVIA
jgi:hypothetical protein